MFGIGKAAKWGLLTIFCASGFSACRKPAEAMKSDLSEAGYQMTTEDWFRAARADESDALKRFIKAGMKADTRDTTGDSALHAAAAAGAQNAADYLLDQGLDANLRGAGERTPLMAAAQSDQASMVRWLIKQGADPQLKNAEGFNALMLSVRDGRAGAVAELAAVHRESLDPALLLAAMTGQARIIDTLTNYGASVYAKMEDGRTLLMIAAQNGHKEAVNLLLDLGASRYSTDASGKTAADFANEANQPELAALILEKPEPSDLALLSEDQIIEQLEHLATPHDAPEHATPNPSPAPLVPIEGQTLSASVTQQPSLTTRPITSEPTANPVNGTRPSADFAMPPLIMRTYREREMPLRLKTVENDTATVEILGFPATEFQLKAGDTIPGSTLRILTTKRRIQDSKLNLGIPTEVSVIEVQDTNSGATREWISGVPASAHDPVALVEDAATGRRYTATPGRRFKSQDGTEFIVSDVRPDQIVIEEAATGSVKTLPLRGPRG